MLIKWFPYMDIEWLAFFDGENKNCPKICFCFFFNRKLIFVLQIFSEKELHANFFSKTLETHIYFLWHVKVCLD